METDSEPLERTETPSLPPTGSRNQGAEAAVPTKPAPADSGSHRDTTRVDQPAEVKPVVPERELGEQFF